MSQRAQELADRFEQMNAAFAAEMERLTPEQWLAVSPEEGRTVAALVRHVAGGYRFEIGAFLSLANGDSFTPLGLDDLAAANAAYGEEHTACDQAETITLLWSNAAAAAAIVRGMTDEQLTRTGSYVTNETLESIDTLIERWLIGHPLSHLPAIRAAARQETEDGKQEAGAAVDASGAREAERDAFVERFGTAVLGFLDIAAIWLGDRLGFYRALADHGSLTSLDLAVRTDTAERYAREWLEQQAVSGILTVDTVEASPESRRYALPAGHAAALVDADSLTFMTPTTRVLVGSALALPAVLEAFRSGGGVPYASYGAEVHEGVATGNRPLFVNLLGKEWLPAIPELHARLQADPPARVADVGCGSGWSSIAIAQAYPAALVDGFDLDEASIAAARANADACGMADRVRFHVRDAGDPGLAGRYDLAIAIECIHDMANPVSALRAMRSLAGTGGTVLVIDEKAAETFTAPGDDLERLLYGFSLVHCLPVGMVEQPSAGTGTAMRPDTLRGYANAAGFSNLEILPIEIDGWNVYRLVA